VAFRTGANGHGPRTGFIIDRDKGWILTNAHVAKRSPSTVEIALGESETEWLPVQRIYVDNHLDIAVLKVATDSCRRRNGRKTWMHPDRQTRGYCRRLWAPDQPQLHRNAGIVSSVRTLNSHEFVQMDANINPGNSGGPLLLRTSPK